MKNIDQARFQNYVEWPLTLQEILWWLQIKLELNPKINRLDIIEEICTSVYSPLTQTCSFTLLYRQQTVAKSEV